MWLMLQEDEPGDYVIATGKSHSVEEFCEQAFKYVEVDNWRRFVEVNDKFIRPSDVEYLCGDSRKARNELGWEPNISFEQLVERMVLSDIQYMEGKPCPTIL
jgi:GDPmannose 4,6-dehydratase